jgi:hypothetical protein
MRYQTDYPSCFEDFILLAQGCSQNLSKSGLYVENLEGMSLKKTAAMASTSYQSANDLVHDKLMHSFNLLEIELQNALSRFGRYMPVYPEIREFCSISNYTNPPAPVQRGLKLTRYKNVNPFGQIFIDVVYVKVKTSINTNIIFKDENGNTVHTIAVSLLSNEIKEVPVNKGFNQSILYILLDNTNIETYQTQCGFDGTGGCCGALKSSRPWKAFAVQGYDSTQTGSNSFGLGLRAGLKCSMKLAMCNILDYIKVPVLYTLGAELLKEYISTDRINFLTIHNKDWAAEKVEEWQEKAKELLASNIMSIMNNLIDYDPRCIVCNPTNKAKLYSIV